MALRLLLIALIALANAYVSSSQAGEWLGGQYIGQISGCGHCGGSLHGLGACYGGACGDRGHCAPLPMPIPHLHEDNLPAGNGMPPAQVPELPVLRSSHTRDLFTSSRRTESRRPQRDILPIAPVRSAGGVKAVTHVSERERLTREPIRVVAPNAWSGRLYR